MVSPYDLKAERVIRALERAGWEKSRAVGETFQVEKSGNRTFYRFLSTAGNR